MFDHHAAAKYGGALLQQFQKLAHPGRVGGPCGGSDEVAVDADAVEARTRWIPGCAGSFEFGPQAGIGLAAAVADEVGGGEDLRAVASSGDRFVGVGKVPDYGEHALVELEVLGCAATGQDQRIILFWFDVVPVDADRKIVAPFFAVSLVTFKVVDGCDNRIAGLLVGAGRIDGVSCGLQNLKRDHRFVVFDEVAN